MHCQVTAVEGAHVDVAIAPTGYSVSYSPSSRLSLNGQATPATFTAVSAGNDSDASYTFWWTITSVDLQTTITPALWSLYFTTPQNRSSLVMAPGAFPGGGQYVFNLAVTTLKTGQSD